MKAIKKSGKLNQTICVNVPILKYGDQFERKKKESFDLIQSLLPVVTVTQVISIVILSHRDVYFSNLLAEIQ